MNEISEKFSQMQKILGNEKRIKILLKLNDSDSSWSSFMQNLDMRNPKLLQDHLNLLLEFSLIEKNSSGLYKLTTKGKLMVNFYLDELSKFSSIQKKW